MSFNLFFHFTSNIFDRESKSSSENSTTLSFDMMFKSTEQQYGFNLHQPVQSDYELYKRYDKTYNIDEVRVKRDC